MNTFDDVYKVMDFFKNNYMTHQMTTKNGEVLCFVDDGDYSFEPFMVDDIPDMEKAIADLSGERYHAGLLWAARKRGYTPDSIEHWKEYKVYSYLMELPTKSEYNYTP